MKKIVSTLLFAFVSVPLLAATVIPSELPMIKSLPLLKAFALHRAASANMSVGSAGQVPNRGLSFDVVNSGNETADDLINRLASTSVNLKLGSWLDDVNLNVTVYDAEGGVLFFGSQQFAFDVEDATGKLVLPRNYKSDFIKLNRRIKIPFPNLQSAEIVFRGRDGKIVTNPDLRLQNGGFILPADWTEHKGDLKLTYLDNGQERTALYDLETGGLRPSASIPTYSSNLPVGLEGYVRANSNSKIINMGSLPKEVIIRYDVTEPLVQTDFWFSLEGGKIPRAVIVASTSPKDPAVLTFRRYTLSPEGRYFGVPFQIGKHFLLLESEVDQFREIQFEVEPPRA